MGRSDATEQEVIEAAKKARCYDLLWNFQMVFRLLLAREAQAYQEEKNNVFLLRALF